MKFLVKKRRERTVRSYGYSYGKGAKSGGSRDSYSGRVTILIVVFFILGGLIVLRLAKLQIIDGGYYYALAYDQHEIFKQLYPERGTIYFQEKGLNGDVDLYPVATNRDLHLVYAVPKDITDPEAVAAVLQEVLDFTDEIKKYKKDVVVDLPDEATAEEINEEKERLEKIDWDEARERFGVELLARLKKADDPYEPIQHRVKDDQIAQLQAYDLEGISWVKERSRFYPEQSVGSQVIGFVGHTNENNLLKGYYGIEGNYNTVLSGEPGYIRSELDGAGRWIAVAGKEFQEAHDGSDVVLTIDKAVQYYACEQLFYGVNNFGADGGSVIAMDPQTGAIMAMCSYPDFNPNEYNKVRDVNVFNNAALLDAYEPGSIFKPLTIAAAIEEGKITPFTTYNDTGEVKIDVYTIHNADLKAHGIQTMTQVLEKSLNTGSIFAARQIGMKTFSEYMKSFGFGELTGIDLSPEAAGDIVSLDKNSEIYMATGSFGQGLTTTPLQMVRAYAALANDGKLVQPYVVDKIIHPDGREEKTASKIVGQVVSPKTSKLVGGMLVSVVENGHGKKAGVKNYLIAGKTGTAQIADTENGGYSNRVNHSFVGYGPLEDPRFVLIVKLDNVKNVPYSSDSAAPVFGKIAKFILDYYEVPPTAN